MALTVSAKGERSTLANVSEHVTKSLTRGSRSLSGGYISRRCLSQAC